MDQCQQSLRPFPVVDPVPVPFLAGELVSGKTHAFQQRGNQRRPVQQVFVEGVRDRCLRRSDESGGRIAVDDCAELALCLIVELVDGKGFAALRW